MLSDTSKEFIFLPGPGNHYSGDVRAHVLKDHMKKRRENIPPANPRLRSTSIDTGRVSRTTYLHDVKYNCSIVCPGCLCIRRDLAPSGTEQTAPLSDISLAYETIPRQDQNQCRTCGLAPASKMLQGFGTSLKIVTTSPIISNLNSRQTYLIHHWLEIPNDIFRVNMAHAKFNPTRDILVPNIVPDTLGIQLACLYAASNLSRAHNNDAEGVECLQIMVCILHELRQRLFSGVAQADDQSILAVLMLIMVDFMIWSQSWDSTNTRVRMKSHVCGVRWMVEHRGGWANLTQCRSSWYLHWTDIRLNGELTFGMTPFSRFLARPYSSKREAYLIEFCSFCRRLNTRKKHPISRFVRPGSALFTMLALPPDADSPCEKLATTSIMIHLLISSFELHGMSETENFMEIVQSNLLGQGATTKSSPHTLLMTLITSPGTTQLECPPRIWLLTRALYVIQRVSADLQSRVNCFLFHQLTNREAGLFGEFEALEADVRDEFLTDLEETI